MTLTSTKPYTKSADMLALEQLFANLKSGKEIEDSLRNMERILLRHFGLEFNIALINNRTNNFFGMSIYPSRSLIDTMVDQMINKKSNSEVIEHLWAQNKKWYLEIDSVLVSDPSLNANPAEMVAILLHEIGHIIFSNTVPARINKVLRYEIMQLSFNMKKLLKWEKSQVLLDLIFAEACSSKNFALKREIDADKFVVKMGYGDNLAQFIDKLLVTQGNALVDRTEKDMEKELKAIVTWTFVNISELQYRKTKLRTMLQTEIIQNPSMYIRNLIFNIKSKFFGGNDENSYKEIVSEQFLIQQHTNVIKEGLLDLFDKYGKLKKLSQSDIDVLTIEKDRIENEDDKIYVLDLIYDRLDEVNAGLELIAENKKDKVYLSKDKFLSYKTQLEKLRKEVLSVKIKDKQYGVFVQYPVGYEG